MTRARFCRVLPTPTSRLRIDGAVDSDRCSVSRDEPIDEDHPYAEIRFMVFTPAEQRWLYRSLGELLGLSEADVTIIDATLRRAGEIHYADAFLAANRGDQ